MPETSSASAENFSNTPISSAALELGWKKPIGGVVPPIGSLRVCQIFQGNIVVMSWPLGRRSLLTQTCGPDEMPMLFARARAVALHISSQSRTVSYSDVPQNAPGTRSKLSP